MVGHIMRLAAYLYISRHGIFYFRFPVPTDLHPARKRCHPKVSLGTREPRDAGFLARLLAVAGQSLLDRPKVRSRRYDEMRDHVHDHFSQMLRSFREKTAAEGPLDEARLDVLRASQALAEDGPDQFTAITSPDDEDALMRDFCTARGIEEILEGRERKLLSDEFFKGYREFLARAMDHTAEFYALTLDENCSPAHRTTLATVNTTVQDVEAHPFSEVVSQYFDEIQRSGALAPKTEADKRDALALLADLTGDKPPARMTKADAQEVKAALFKLPKNRTKNPKTRNLPLKDMLEVTGVPHIAARIMNVYIGNMQSFFA